MPRESCENRLRKPSKIPSECAPLAVVGTVAIDSVETPFGKRDRVFGGSASYFSYAASFFTTVALVAVVGRDFPAEYRSVLGERPIDLTHLDVLEGETFFWKGSYMEDLNAAKTHETRLNVLLDFKPCLRFHKNPEYLFLANIDPVLQMNLLDQLKKPKLKFVACDTMNYWIEHKRDVLQEVFRRIDCLIVNDGEARLLTGETNLIKAARKVQEMGPGQVIIKKGEHGAFLFCGSHFFSIPAYPLESLFDPTGAGDSFAGGFMGYLTSTQDLGFENMKKAVAVGSVVASFTVEDFGLDRLRRLKKSQIEERLEIFRKINRF